MVFAGTKSTEILSENRKGRIRISRELLTEEEESVVSYMLELNPKLRPSVNDCLECFYLSEGNASTVQQSQTLLQTVIEKQGRGCNDLNLDFSLIEQLHSVNFGDNTARPRAEFPSAFDRESGLVRPEELARGAFLIEQLLAHLEQEKSRQSPIWNGDYSLPSGRTGEPGSPIAVARYLQSFRQATEVLEENLQTCSPLELLTHESECALPSVRARRQQPFARPLYRPNSPEWLHGGGEQSLFSVFPSELLQLKANISQKLRTLALLLVHGSEYTRAHGDGEFSDRLAQLEQQNKGYASLFTLLRSMHQKTASLKDVHAYLRPLASQHR